MVCGSTPQHRSLELALRDWLQTEDALLFSSGYAANVGALSALADGRAALISDTLNHASLIDGCRLSRAELRIVPHLSLPDYEQALRASRHAESRWVVVESYYSMDGDSPDLRALRQLCDDHDAHLLVDEAHALGVFGPGGRGLCAASGIVPDVLIGTFGKALGAQGAFVACSSDVRTWLWNRARSFVFSTAPAPFLSQICLDNLADVIASDPQRSHLETLCALARSRLRREGLRIPNANHGPILPILIGSSSEALEASARLLAAGYLVQAIRPPTVPQDSARLRLTLNAAMPSEQVERLCDAVVRAVRRQASAVPT